MNRCRMFPYALALLPALALADPAAQRAHAPQADPPVGVPAVRPPGAAFPSSGGYRAPTQSGSGDEPVRLEARPRASTPPRHAGFPRPAPMTDLTAQSQNGITFLCGGVGQDEADAMKAAARDYDLMLTFSARDGSYLADINVDIADGQGNSLVKTTCDGPIMLVQTGKSGNYRIRAETGGTTISRMVRVQDQSRSLVLVWPMQAVRGLAPEPAGADQSR